MPGFKRKGTLVLPCKLRDRCSSVWAQSRRPLRRSAREADRGHGRLQRPPEAEGPEPRSRLHARQHRGGRAVRGRARRDCSTARPRALPDRPGLHRAAGRTRRLTGTGRLPGTSVGGGAGDHLSLESLLPAARGGPRNQVDPLFYDSELTTAASYEQWVREGLAYYSENVPQGVAIIPVIPCYAKDPWHSPAVENIPNATAAVGGALEAGSRVEGVGLWWWYGFYEGHLNKHFSAASERAAWQQLTVNLPYRPDARRPRGARRRRSALRRQVRGERDLLGRASLALLLPGAQARPSRPGVLAGAARAPAARAVPPALMSWRRTNGPTRARRSARARARCPPAPA